MLLAPGATQSQPARPPQPVLRADAIVARRATAHAGVGVTLPVSTYVRAEAVAGAGTIFAAAGPRPSARADVLARFTIDPFRQLRSAPYGGGGLSVRREAGATRADVLVVLGVERTRRRGYAPALELGLGGGVRVGVVFRRVPVP